MAMHPDDIKALLLKAMPDAHIELVDTVGDGDHYQATIISSCFIGLSRLQQHQLVYQALGEKMDHQLHALSLKTYPPQQG